MDATSNSKGQSIVITIENDQANDLTKEVRSLRKIVLEQQKQIDALKDKQWQLNDRLRAQERYTRKDSVLKINLLLTPEQLQMLCDAIFFWKNFANQAGLLWCKSMPYGTRDVET